MERNLLKKIYEYFLDNKTKLLIFVVLIYLHKFFEEKVSEYLVSPVLSESHSHYVLDVIFLFLFILIITSTAINIKNKHVYNINSLLISLIIVIVFLFYRCINLVWYFVPLESFACVKYLDIILIYFLSIITSHLFVSLANYLAKSLEKVEDKPVFYYDNSLGEEGKDLLGRSKVAEKISNKIINTPTNNSSFAIGITGEWGSGKSSFFDLMKQDLSKKDNVLVIDFNPWLNHGADSITQDFFSALSTRIKPFNSNLSNEINQYSDVILESGSVNKGVVEILKRFVFPMKSIKEEFDDINEAIKKIDRKVVVFIDDLDRLYKEEIIETIRIIRNTANFSNIFFIVAYDKNYIINALRDINLKNSPRLASGVA